MGKQARNYNKKVLSREGRKTENLPEKFCSCKKPIWSEDDIAAHKDCELRINGSFSDAEEDEPEVVNPNEAPPEVNPRRPMVLGDYIGVVAA